MDHTDVRSERRRFALVALASGTIAFLAALDLVIDLAEGITVKHALLEGSTVLLAAAGITFGIRRYALLRRRSRAALRMTAELESQLTDSQVEAQRWRVEAQEHLQGLGTMIDHQFDRWQLTPAEREVALLLLKGFSHKEIAAARTVGSATVRQQATGIYRKAAVEGRHDLSAFFLEDLLSPQLPRAQSPAPPATPLT